MSWRTYADCRISFYHSSPSCEKQYYTATMTQLSSPNNPAESSVDNGSWATAVHWLKVLVATIVFVVTLLGLGSWLAPDFDPFHVKKGKLKALPPVDRDSQILQSSRVRLVADSDDEEKLVYEPFGPSEPTPVYVEHWGERSCLLTKAVFKYEDRYRTPNREAKSGGVIALPLNFEKRQRRGARNYPLRFRPPIAVGKDDFIAVEVAVIDKNQVGWTYRGTLKLYYNGEVEEIENVVVDILEKKPEPKSEDGAN